MNHVLTNAKAYAALAGAVLTAVIAGSDSAPSWLTIAAAVATAIATWSIPNAEEE